MRAGPFLHQLPVLQEKGQILVRYLLFYLLWPFSAMNRGRPYLPIVCLVSKIPLHGSSLPKSIVRILKSSGCMPRLSLSQLSGAETVAPAVARRLYGAAMVFPRAF